MLDSTQLCFEEILKQRCPRPHCQSNAMVESVLLQIHDVVVLLVCCGVVVWLLVTAQLRPTDQAVAVASGSAV